MSSSLVDISNTGLRRSSVLSTYSTSSVTTIQNERTPLVPKANDSLTSPTTYRKEVHWLFSNSLPIVVTYMLQTSLQMASVFSLGHIGPTELAAAALANMFAAVSAWSLASGTTTALDTMLSQAWTGASDKTLVGVHLQRALIILAIMFIPISMVWWRATDILLALNQEPQLAQYAGTFLRYLLIGAPANIAFEGVKKFCQAQGIMNASTWVLLIVAPINALNNYLLVWYEPISLGFIGAPIATSFTYWLQLILLLLYIKFVRGHEAWGGWSMEAFKDWWPFIQLAIPGIFMVCSEWWSWEISALAASYISETDLAAQSIILTSAQSTYVIPFGISVAASNRVGNLLGCAAAGNAKKAARVAMAFAIVFGLLNSGFFLATRNVYGYLFTSDPDVVSRVASILPMCALFQIADSAAGVCGGVVRGLGRQKIAAILNLVAYYLIALPLAYVLTFKLGWGLHGIWTGLTLALFIAGAGLIVFLMNVNWKTEVLRTLARVQHAEEELKFNTTHSAL
ncbi:unnamed protein product [Umbelopsis ramanniana]